MVFLFFSIAALAIAYVLEWRIFGKRCGLSAVLIWVFSIQILVLSGINLALRHGWAPATPSWTNAFVQAVGAAAYSTIGLTPIFALFAGIMFVIVQGLRLLQHRR